MDRDGWVDGVDSNPVSRAVIPWGDSLYTSNDFVIYPQPDWLLSAFKTEGEWDTNGPSWHVPASASGNVGRLSIDLDRDLLTNNLRFDLWLYNDTGSSLYADLYGTNDETLSSNLFGNLIVSSTSGPAWRMESVPLATNPAAAGIRLRRGIGAVTVYETRLYIDEDGDGLDADQERQLGTSDRLLDSDGDGFADYAEVVSGMDPAQAGSYPHAAVWGNVTYAGSQTGAIHVAAVTNAGAWTSPWSVTVTGPGPYTLTNVPIQQTYWVRGYRDSNQNNTNDTWEACGGVGSPVYLMGNAGYRDFVLTDPDSDLDGMSDFDELRYGRNALSPDAYTVLPFVEGFETNTCRVGPVDGQNGWESASTNGAWVQTNVVYAGTQSLAMATSQEAGTEVRHLFVCTNQTVWVEAVQRTEGASTTSDMTTATAAWCFDNERRLVVYDGLAGINGAWVTLSNAVGHATGSWARVTARADYGARRWLVCLDGTLAATNLGFGVAAPNRLTMLAMSGQGGYADNVQVSLTPPDGIDLDADGMSDDWELAHGLDPANPADVSDDQDNDGLDSLAEYQRGTDPEAWDTDRDGFSDGDEVLLGFDPLDDASLGALRTGLQLWLQANLLNLTNGAAVTTWADLSGQDHDVMQAVPANAPVYRTNAVAGFPAVEFDGANDYLSGTVGGMTGGVSVVVVCRFNQLHQPNGNYDYVLKMGQEQALRGLSVSRCAADYAAGWADAYYSWMGTASYSGPALPGQQWMILSVVHGATGASHSVWVDGAPKTAQSYAGTLQLNGALELGRYSKPGFVNHWLDGEVAEALVYERALGDGDRTEIEGYLKAKYGLNLPPQVNAGPDQPMGSGQAVTLSGTVSDDGFPQVPGCVSSLWSQVAGPGVATFANAAVPATTVSFSTPGAYRLRLTAWDGAAQSSDDVDVLNPVAGCTNVVPQGLRLWLKADELAQNSGDPVLRWPDRSGQGHDVTQTTAGNAPVYRTNAVAGFPAVEFDGTDDYLAGAVGGMTGGVSVLVVCRFDQLHQPNGNYDYVLKMGQEQALRSLTVSRCAGDYAAGWADAYYSWMGSASYSGPVLTGQQWIVLSVVHGATGASHSVSVDGAAKAAQPYTGILQLDGALELGRYLKPGYVNHWLDGRVAEVLVYDRALARSDRFRIEEYLGAKYGVAVTEDADHDGLPDWWEVQYGLNPANSSDWACDSDNDGLNNLEEYRHGTNPMAADTDGDGMSDFDELRYGRNALSPDAYAVLPFVEGFETNTCRVGPVDGQNGWESASTNGAWVQTNVVYAGTQSLAMATSQEAGTEVRHLFVCTNQTVWVEAVQRTEGASTTSDMTTATAAWCFDNERRLVVYDGLAGTNGAWVTLSNAVGHATGSWARVTARADYGARRWLVCLDGTLAATNLGFGVAAPNRLTMLAMSGQGGHADNVVVSPIMPPGIDLDADGMSDDWELAHGLDPSSSADASADADNDGLTNLEELQQGTDPRDADSDNDGLPDGWELDHGLDPSAASDSSADPDNDGLSILDEFQLGTAPLDSDTDHDGLLDGLEVNLLGTDPLNPDTDGDGVSDSGEIDAGTDPLAFASSAWAAYTHRMRLPVRDTQRTVTLTNFPVLVVLNPTRVDYATCPPQGAGVRFADARGHELSHEIETWNTNGDSFVWVRVPELPADGSGAWLTMFWGNSAVTNPASGAAGVWDTAFAGVWHLADTGERVSDSTRSQWAGSNHGADRTNGVAGGARHFDGTAQVDMPVEAFRNVGDGCTLSLWLRGDENPRHAVGMAFNGVWNVRTDLMCMMVTAGGGVTWQAYQGDACGKALPSSQNAGRWNHWVFTKDPHTGTMAVYLNGQLWLQAAGMTSSYRLVDRFKLGSQWDGSVGYRGSIDEFRVANVVRSPEWVKAEYAAMSEGLLTGFGVTPPAVGSTNDVMADELKAVVTNDYTVVNSKPGTDTSYRFGEWAETNGVLVAQIDRGMRVEYRLAPPTAGMYRVAIRVANGVANSAPVTFRMQALYDAVPIQWLNVTVPAGTNACGFMLTPWLTATNHTLRLAWLDDYAAGKRLAIQSIQLQRVDGPDANTNGVPDWMETILGKGRDTDGDGLSDASELTTGYCLLASDSDGDTLGDGEEINLFGTDPLAACSTNGISDAALVAELNGMDTAVRYCWVGDTDWYEDGTALANTYNYGHVEYAINVSTAGLYRLALRLRNHHGDPPDDYRFGVEVSVNGCKVGVVKILADTDRAGIGYQLTPWLTPGTHRIRLQWLNPYTGWMYTSDQQQRVAVIDIEKLQLYAIHAPDADTNGVPDGSDAELDPWGDTDTDGDGLTDMEEMILGTSAVLADTDGDGLTDSEELLLGTDPLAWDSDGDGVSDGVEVDQAFTDPLSADFDGTRQVLAFVPGAQVQIVHGAWDTDGSSIHAVGMNGEVRYSLTIPSNGVYAVELIGKQYNTHTSQDAFDLSIFADDVFSGRQTLRAPQGSFGTALYFLPYMQAGTHTLRVKWANVAENTFLEIIGIRLLALGGPDGDHNGTPDWVDHRLAYGAGLAVCSVTSLVSPVCVEGESRYQDLVSITASYVPPDRTQQVVAVKHGVGAKWYADVLLSPTNATAIGVTEQHGQIAFATNVLWQPLDLLTYTNALVIRRNDALLLTAWPEGVTNGLAAITILNGTNAVTNFTAEAAGAVLYTFDTAGTYTLFGTYSNETTVTNHSVTVRAVTYAFAGNPACMLGQVRYWTCPVLPQEARIEADPRLELLPEAGITNALKFSLRSNATEAQHLVARLSRPGLAEGPILAGATVTTLQAADQLEWRVVTEFPDGSVMLQAVLQLSAVPSDLSVHFRIFAGGVIFDDGTIERTIVAADFDEAGRYVYYMLMPGAYAGHACHTTAFIQNGAVLAGSE